MRCIPRFTSRRLAHENTSTLLITLKHSSKFSGKAESGIGSQQTLVLLPSLALPFASISSISSISSRISIARCGAQMQCLERTTHLIAGAKGHAMIRCLSLIATRNSYADW